LLVFTIGALLAVGYGSTFVNALAANNSTTTAPVVLIHEVKPGGDNTPITDYVTLHNQTDQNITLDGWTIEAANTKLPSASCAATDWKTVSATTSGATVAVVKIPINTVLPAHTTSAPIAIAINNSGSVHIVDTNHTVIDMVGWGSNASPAACKFGDQAPMLAGGQSLIRYANCLATGPINTDDNAADFMLNTTPDPTKANTTQAAQCTPTTDNPDEPINNLGCQNVAISEVLPNPAGTDTGHEFIELRNTSNADNDISGCSLQTSANSKVFDLTGVVLAPGQYYLLSDSQSGLTLSNTSGGSVWLMDSTEELQTVTYPADMEDDVSWTLADGQWDTSYTPTPAAANIITATKPCPAGQIRNSETNRCVNISSDQATPASGGLTPCDAGQERNPDTNRCRTIASAANTSVTACKVGQERNPETNRCRAIPTATTDSKACPAGQERNPKTNRCRKIATLANTKDGGGLGDVRDVASEQIQKNKPYWLVAGIILVGAIGYAVYEWRQEMRLLWSSWLSRIKRTAGRSPSTAR